MFKDKVTQRSRSIHSTCMDYMYMHGLHVHACTQMRLRHQHSVQHDSATCSSMLRDVLTAAQSRFLATPVIEMTVHRSYIVEGLNRLPGDQPRFSSAGAASLLPQIVHQRSIRPGVARTRNVGVFLPFHLREVETLAHSTYECIPDAIAANRPCTRSII